MYGIRLVLIVCVIALPINAVLAAPPSRPAPLTEAQFAHLQQLEQTSAHAGVSDVQATYTSADAMEDDRAFYETEEFIQASDDFWTIAYIGGFPLSIAWMLVAAAPL